MTQKITFTIKPPPDTKKMARPPTRYLFITFAFISIALIVGFLLRQESHKAGDLRLPMGMACVFVSMSILAMPFYVKKSCRFEARQTAEGMKFQKKVGATILAVTASAISTALIVNPENAESFHFLWIICIGFASVVWSVFLIVLLVIGSQSYTLLSESGIGIYTLFQSDKVVLWDDCPEPYMIHPQTVALTIDGKDVYASAGGESVDPRIMAALINYYRTHPEHRHELATGETIERLKTGHLPIDWTLTPQPQISPEQEP